MKYKIGLLCLLFPVFAAAQTKTPIDSLVKIKLNDLFNSWTLGIDSTTDVVDIKVYNKFKSLFDTTATIDDDFNVFYQYNHQNKSGSYNIKKVGSPKSFDTYAHDVALEIKNILIDSVVTVDSNKTDLKHITFTIARRVTVQKTRQYVVPDDYIDEVVSSRKIEFEDKKIDSSDMISNLKTKISANQEAIYKFISTDTILVSMAFEKDTVNITGIKSIANKVESVNDADYDGVLNFEDSLPNTFGDFTANGMPDDDLDGAPNGKDKCKFTYSRTNQGCPPSYFFTKHEFDGFIGLQLNSVKISLPELSQLGYLDASGRNLIDQSQSNPGILKNPGMIPGIYAGGHFTWYFGQQRKRSGITVGFTYSGVNAEYQLTLPIVYTFKSSDGSNSYRRQIIDSSLSEGIKYNIFNFPVLFNYRFHLDKKYRSVLKLQAGPSLMIFNNTSDYNATIDFGGLYQTDNNGAITYNDRFDPTSTYNIFFTSQKINAQNPNPGASNVFDQLRSKGYDFAENKNYRGKQHLTRITVAFNLNLDFQYKISEGLTLKAGPHLVYAPLVKGKEKYKMVDKTTDEYQSIYKGNAAASYSAFGVNLGFVYNF